MITISICWVHWKENIKYSTYILVWEGFCPPYYFHGRDFVRPVIFTGGLFHPVIFTGGLLSTLSFSREGFCPPCHFLTGGLLSGRAFVLHSKKMIGKSVQIFNEFKIKMSCWCFWEHNYFQLYVRKKYHITPLILIQSLVINTRLYWSNSRL
jgi:hypothetical protein